GHHVDTDFIRIVDDPPNQMLDGVDDGRAHSAGVSAASAAGSTAAASAAGSTAAASAAGSTAAASTGAASSAFLAGAFFFFAWVASPDGAPSACASAALNRSSLLGLGSLTFSVPSAPGRPLNFCQSPVIFSSARTGSVGWAPTLSQYWARSESTSMRLGSSFGWYRPM